MPLSLRFRFAITGSAFYVDRTNMAEVDAPADPAFAPPIALSGGAKGKLGKVLAFEGASPTMDRAEIATLCGAHGEVAFVDFRFGETLGYVRFRSTEGAAAALAALSGGSFEIAGATPRWRLLGDDEATAYWEQSKKARVAAGASAASAVAPRPSHKAGSGGAGAIVLRFEQADPQTNRTDLTALCAAHGEVAFVDFSFGSTAGYVRFRSPEGAQAALAALGDGKTVIGGATPQWHLLSEEEEHAYREAVQQAKKRPRDERAAAAASSRPPAEPSAVLLCEGVGSAASREDLATLCGTHGAVAFVDYRAGNPSGHVRFVSGQVARAALHALVEGTPTVGGATPSWRLLTEAEAEAYRDHVAAQKRQRAEGGGDYAPGKGKGGGGRRAPRGWGIAFSGRGRG